jgi:hypothetical protein
MMTMCARRRVCLMTGVLVGMLLAAVSMGAQATGAAQSADPITGEWVGEADVQGQSMPIALYLKLDGEMVTGEIESAVGRVPLTSGSWKESVLVITFPYAGGEPVSMGGQIQDGKLVGVFDYNGGEVQGTWTAVRRQGV